MDFFCFLVSLLLRCEKSHPALKKSTQSRKKKSKKGRKNMQRYLVSFSYIGTHFHGLAAQRGLEGNLRFIQSVIEGSLESFIQYPIQICLSSRTDAGVHALRNTFHVDLIRRKKHTGEIVRVLFKAFLSGSCFFFDEIFFFLSSWGNRSSPLKATW